MGPGLDTVDRASTLLDPDEVVPEVVELLFHLRLSGFADGDHADDRRNSDRDGQDRQEASRLIPEQ